MSADWARGVEVRNRGQGCADWARGLGVIERGLGARA